MPNPTPVLDRRVLFDRRSLLNFHVKHELPSAYPRSYTWSVPMLLNQNIGCYHCNHYGGCVGHASVHAMAANPSFRPISYRQAWDTYHLAQTFDPEHWNTPPEEGSSILGGMKALTQLGQITEYRWATSLVDWILAVGLAGGGVAGTSWKSGMWDTDSEGFVHARGEDVGGHAYYINSVKLVWQPGALIDQKRSDVWFRYLNPDRSYFGFAQSWGRDWGLNGFGKLSFTDADILRRQDGELAVPVRRKRLASVA